MSALMVLRVLTAAAVIALDVILIRLLLRRRALPAGSRAAWTAVAVIELLLSAGYLQAELLALGTELSASAAVLALRRALYNPAYFLNAVWVAALPPLLLRALSRSKRIYAAGTAWLGAIVIGAVASYALGATSSWDSLLSATPLFTVVCIGGYLLMWVLVAAERLPAMDVYLAAFLVMRTVYEIVKPVQEMFFQAFTREEVQRIWHLHLLLQLMQRLGMIAAVWLLLEATRRGRSPRSVLSPKFSTTRS